MDDEDDYSTAGKSNWRNRPRNLNSGPVQNFRRPNNGQPLLGPGTSRQNPQNRGPPRPRNMDSSTDRLHNRFSNRPAGQRNSEHHHPARQPQQREGLYSFGLYNDDSRQPGHTGGSRNPNSFNRQQDEPQNRRRRNQFIGFITLEKIANTETKDIFLKLSEHREGLMTMINSPIQGSDIYILIFEILAKVSQSPFDELKSKLILDVCNSEFISNLRNYLMDLPYTENKSPNRLYWNNQSAFWKNFVIFCGDIVEISPAVAVKRCRALIENISKTCLEYLNERHDFVLAEEYMTRLDELRNRLKSYADGNKSEKNREMNEADVDMKPPEDFRELSVVPTRADLLQCQPFLRPNIVAGGYSDVQHYLDVQFRLLREDCLGPLRVGIHQYLADPNKRKYDNVRVYQNVKFIGPYISNLKIGRLVQIDIENNKQFKRINWAHSKRFLFGSLVLFTTGHTFDNVIVATILDRDNVLLANGRIAISIINTSNGTYVRDGDTFTMIESEVYYEPYYHVLKALQAETFPQHLAMQQYIVHVTPSSDAPAYLTEDTEYSIVEVTTDSTSKTSEELHENDLVLPRFKEDLPAIKWRVLQPESWPSKDELHFNESQYEAYKLALTHEFAVIQGPPGTGKTYVGLNVAKALLQNIESENGCLMLVICYTNHALDQFLDEISKVTKDIVRIGSQSRNKAMDQFNLSTLRKLQGFRMSRVADSFMETKAQLKKSIDEFQETLLLLDILNHDVINCKAFEDEIPQIKLLCNYYQRYPSIQDPLMHWLFENNGAYYTDFNQCLEEYANFDINDMDDNEFNNRRTEYNIMLDDDKDKRTHLADLKKRVSSFSLIDAKLALKDIVLDYTKTKKKFHERYQAEMMIQDINSKINLFQDMLKYRSRELPLNITENTDFSKIIPQNRWRLYFMWIKNKVNALKRDVAKLQSDVSPVVAAYEETRMVMDMELLRKKKIKVLGMTTSGAARMRKLLQAIAPKIVIVEEAAEVLEQHIITSLTKDCQHLILIGDHQQLRPSASYMKLAKQYNIEVSLFERMITNGIHSRRLSVQHRMRPEVAALISPHIYPDLQNHPSVENLGDVPGLEKNVFFFSHEYPEEVNPNDNTSKANHKEADITLALANYIIQQGYSGEDVTILAAYSGQMFYMRKERKNYARLTDVKITVVDNYQGEESKIILLSLVRNNRDNNIGFLGTENRICVALSRAKQGFYIFGNINMLKSKSELWTKISSTLESNGSLGTTLNLKCQVHPDQITPIQAPEDFDKVPEGGCFRKCNYQYSCGHVCLLYCHGYDREHIVTKCTMKCERVLCDLGHVCPLKCCEECEPCKVLMMKTLPCGHDMMVYCHREPDDPKNRCHTKLEVTLPSCGHKVQKLCYEEIDKVKCTEKCKQRLEKCGHACERLCHVAYPGHSEYICTKDCGKAKKGCTAGLDGDLGEHECKKKCSEPCSDCNVQVAKKRLNCKHVERVACCLNIDETPCKKKCARNMECGHHCKKLCFEQCGDCNVKVTKVIPDCGHKIKVDCKKTVSRRDCNEKCKRTLSCGHPCTERCGAECERARCAQLISARISSPCGHEVQLPCNVYALFTEGKMESMELVKYCLSPCAHELSCSHLCGGTCAQCHQGRLHVPCRQTCNQINICGHQCQEPCNQICPPCSQLCEVQCQHSSCGQICGEPCVPCKEKCSRRCPHGACTRRCSAPCSRAPCDEACGRALPCGHRCRGVCGEPCPPVCKDCRPDEFPTDFLGDEYGEDDKFILLQDCGHVLELENMDNLMMGDRENIQIRPCPFCRKPIINTNRYKDIVNDMFKNEINPIKLKVYGKETNIKEKMKELSQKVVFINKRYLQGHHEVIKLFRTFVNFVGQLKKKNMHLLQMEMLLIYCNIIEMIQERWQAYKNTKSAFLLDEMDDNIGIILKALKIELKSKIPIKISQQQQNDIGNEIKRLNAIAQLAKLLEVSKHLMTDQSVKNQVDITKAVVLSISMFDEDKAVESIKVLQNTLKTSEIVVTKLERQMIVAAVGLRAGHWYKCPNGHFYCIGDCGRANQVSKCADCGAQIGGTGYRLLPNNARAMV